MKNFVAAALVAVCLACASTTSGEAQQTRGVTATPGQAAPLAGAVSSGWVGLNDGRMHAGGEAPRGLHVRGALKDGAFEAAGDVEGDGVLATEGQPSWLDLRSGKVHSDQEAMAPVNPYVKGFRAPDGTFSPSSRTVVK